MTKFSALEAALQTVWAIEPSALENLLTIAAREHDVTPEALEAYRANRHADAESMTVRNGVAILAINGPLIKRATFFSAISGATSYDILRRDLQTALDDPKIKAILFDIDSPGGQASGPAELASAIYAARSVKPIRAYVNGDACSAAYWIAAAAGPGNIIVDPTAMLGSIGVQMAIRTQDEPKGVNTFRFVSSQSPMKNADPGTEDGAKHLQGVVDAMAQVFVESVAEYRGVAPETVLSNFGKGGIFVGKDAIKAGLADRIGNFESVLAELTGGRSAPDLKGQSMTSGSYHNAGVDAAVATALANLSNRGEHIRRIAAGFGSKAADVAAALSSGMSVEAFALAEADKAAARRAQTPEQAAKAREAEIDALVAQICGEDVGASVEVADEDDVDALAARIAAA